MASSPNKYKVEKPIGSVTEAEYPVRLPTEDGTTVLLYAVCPCCSSTLWRPGFVSDVGKASVVVARAYQYRGRHPRTCQCEHCKKHPKRRGGSIFTVREYTPEQVPQEFRPALLTRLHYAMVRAGRILDWLPWREFERVVTEFCIPDWFKNKVDKLRVELRYWREYAKREGTYEKVGRNQKVHSKHVRRLETFVDDLDFANPYKRVASKKVKLLPLAVDTLQFAEPPTTRVMSDKVKLLATVRDEDWWKHE